MHAIRKRFYKYVPGVTAIALLVLATVGIATFAPKGLHLAPSTAQASGTAITGWAWSSNIGWVSFSGTAANSTAYGVTVGAGGVLSGYAWGDGIGWINFGSNSCGATPTLSGGALTGWAQAISTGSDGCISLNGTANNGTPYSITLSGSIFAGYAWASDTIGWLSFSGTASNGTAYAVNYGGGSTPTCTINAVPNPTGAGSSITLNYTTTNSPTTGTIIQGRGVPASTVIYLTSGTSWTVPSDWNNANNSIEVIGGGGGAAWVTYGTTGGGGGGGGAYSKITNLSLTPGATIAYSVGSGGTSGASPTGGTDTYFCNSASNCSSIAGTAVQVGAKGGSAGNVTNGGAGGISASSVGTTKYSGGGGGAASTNAGAYTSGGGGGAAGPAGAGAVGGSGFTSSSSGGGGGNGAGTAGSIGTANNGGAGGNSGGGATGGAGATGTSAAGNGSGGSGGGGGFAGTGFRAGGNGGNGVEWDSTHGSGGGGGAAKNKPTEEAASGGGGLYGGGAGGASDTGTHTGGNGAQGIIVVTYTPNNIITNGATNSSGAVSATAPSSAGSYPYTMNVSNPAGSGACQTTLIVGTDVCTDIAGLQSSLPSGCSGPTPSPSGSCIPSGDTWSGSACVVASPSITSFFGPVRVRSGSTATLKYTISNPPASCSITGATATTTSFSTNITPTNGVQGSVNTQVYANTIFTLTCSGVTSSITVGIDPTIIEQ